MMVDGEITVSVEVLALQVVKQLPGDEGWHERTRPSWEVGLDGK
jgi:hypothetical protein